MTHIASNKQLALISSLVTQIQALDADTGATYAEVANTTIFSGGCTGTASRFIDELFGVKRELQRRASQAKATVETQEIGHGFHQVTIDGVTKILKVKHPRGGGRPYTYGVKAEWPDSDWGDDLYNDGKWFYQGRQFNHLLSKDTLLDATDAAAFGHKHGWCIVCSTTLEDPESVHDGIGPSCYKTITGETKAQARKAERLAALPEYVKAEIKARRAAQKTNRDAERRALAEVA